MKNPVKQPVYSYRRWVEQKELRRIREKQEAKANLWTLLFIALWATPMVIPILMGR